MKYFKYDSPYQHEPDTVYIIVETYPLTNTPKIQIVSKDGEPLATATSEMVRLKDNEVAIKDYHENIGMYKFLLNNNLITPPHRHIYSKH